MLFNAVNENDPSGSQFCALQGHAGSFQRCGGEELRWNIQISLSRGDAGLLEIDLKIPPAVDQFQSLLGRQCADEMPAHEVKDCIAGLLAAEGVDHDAVPAV